MRATDVSEFLKDKKVENLSCWSEGCFIHPERWLGSSGNGSKGEIEVANSHRPEG
jgi:hypothetical protein